MRDFTFITGNQNKVNALSRYLGLPIQHRKIALDELQSLELTPIIEHKVRQAYAQVGTPVLVEDTSVEFAALGQLPGPFIRFFVEQMPLETLCSLVDGKDRSATARVTFGYYDGIQTVLFEGKLEGTIAEKPSPKEGWDWDRIFIPTGYTVPKAELDDVSYEKTARMLRPYEAIKDFLLQG